MKCIRCGQEMYSLGISSSDTVCGNYVKTNYVCPKCGQALDYLVYREPLTATIPFNLDDYEFAIHCILCGKEVIRSKCAPVSMTETVMVCDDCKKAIAWAKEKMKEKENENNK